MRNNLVEWERKNGYKANFVADKLGLTPSQYSKLKHGKRRATIETAERLHKEFDVEDPILLLKNAKDEN